MKKRIAVVTGASGGIGCEFVRILCQEGLDEIWMLGRSLTKLREVVKERSELESPKLVPVPFDLTQREEFSSFSEKLKVESPSICFLINNAGIAAAKASTEFSEDEIVQTINLNCTAPVLLTNLCIPYMEKGSHILNLSSASAFQPVPYINLYASTKAFERSYSRALNVELKRKGITVTAVCPSWVDTKLLNKEANGKKIHFAGMVSPVRVVRKAMMDAKKGKDMSICSFYVKCQHFNVKIWPQRFTMSLWMKQIKKYLTK